MAGNENAYQPKSIAIIDDDNLMVQLVEKYCEELGFTDIATFGDAESAWKAMQERQDPFEFIISDWQIPGLSGVGFFNRIKTSERYSSTPLIIISGFLNKNDFVLLDDYPMSALLEKPFTKVLIQKAMENLIKEKAWYSDSRDQIASVIAKSKKDPKTFGERILESIKASPNPVKFGIHFAKKLRELEDFHTARLILSWVVKQDPNNIMAMMECARVFKETGNLREALGILNLANHISPQNIERLCLGGEVNLQLGDGEVAKKAFESALAIDSANLVAQAGATLSDNLVSHLATYDKYNLPSTFAGLLNLLGIEKVRAGDYSDGMKQYDAALVFIKEATNVAKLRFNKGLGYLRWGKHQDALGEFKVAHSIGGEEFLKSSKYIGKLQEYLDSIGVSAPFTGVTVEDSHDSVEESDDSFDSGMDIGLFNPSEEDDDGGSVSSAPEPFDEQDEEVDDLLGGMAV